MSETQTETLQRIFLDLNSDDSSLRLAALRELGALNYSSHAILRRLEQIASRDPNPAARRFAMEVLENPTHRFIQKSVSQLPQGLRNSLLQQIREWQDDGLLPTEQADVLRRRYDFDSFKPRPVTPPAAEPAPAAAAARAPRPEAAPVAPAVAAKAPAPAAAMPEAGAAAPAREAEPKASLTQRLLSQSTVNVFLYLGAFLVIGAALILAALVQTARLPILGGVTVVFAASAVALKKRLPQPSFALFIVFSFLLPILASVLAESLNLTGASVDAYWSLVLLIMAAIWAFSTWFYASRLFSVVAFVSLGLSFMLFPSIFTDSLDWRLLATSLAMLAGLAGASLLKSWKGDKFARPLFLVAQLAQAVMLLTSFVAVMIHLIGGDVVSSADWIAISLTWAAAACFYGWSDLLVTFPIFRWAAVAALMPVAWFSRRTFSAGNAANPASWWIWGALYAAASEVLARNSPSKARSYSLILLLGSVPLFAVAALWGLSNSLSQGFWTLAGAAVVYAVLQVIRPRAALWTTTLVFGVAAYFTFFASPGFDGQPALSYKLLGFRPAFSYQLLTASLLLLLPELFMKFPGGPRRLWREPLIWLGTVVTLMTITAELLLNDGSRIASICFGVYALLSAAYALHFQRPRLGYLATASAALAVLFTLWPITGDIWLPVFTGVTAAYYVAGLVLRRWEKTRPWADVFALSGMALGALTGLFALSVLKPLEAMYVVAIAAMFFAETHLRPEDRLEILGPLFLSCAAVIAMPRQTDNDSVRLLLVVSLIWFIVDLVYIRTIQKRRLAIITRGAGVAIAMVNLAPLLGGMAEHRLAALCFAIYAMVAVVYALQFHRPALGYIATTSAAAAVYYAMSPIHGDTWLPVFTGLSVLYYAGGLILRARERTRAWGVVLRSSALALGIVLTTVALIGFTKAAVAYIVVLAALFFAETYLRPDDRLEIAGPLFLSVAAILALPNAQADDISRLLLVVSLVWLIADVVYARTLKVRRASILTRGAGVGIAFANSLMLVSGLADASIAALCFGVYAAFAAFDAWFYRLPELGYAATSLLAGSVLFALHAAGQNNWLYAIVILAVVYYAAGYLVRRRQQWPRWSRMLIYSGVGLATLNALSAPMQSGLQAAIPVAIAATLYAVEAFALRNVWLGFPANLLYLEAYYLILISLKVDQPQFYSVGAALLGILMHYLLTRAGSKTGAFLTGMFSQLVLLGTSYIQLFSTEQLGFFVALFLQALVVLGYGIVIRSRSLVLAPIAFIVLSVITVVYSALKGLSTVILIGGAGIVLLLLGILAVVLRERLVKFSDQWSGWRA